MSELQHISMYLVKALRIGLGNYSQLQKFRIQNQLVTFKRWRCRYNKRRILWSRITKDKIQRYVFNREGTYMYRWFIVYKSRKVFRFTKVMYLKNNTRLLHRYKLWWSTPPSPPSYRPEHTRWVKRVCSDAPQW